MSLYKKDLVTIANHLLHKYLCRSFSVLWSERWFSFLLLLRICTLGNWYVWMQRSCPVNFFQFRQLLHDDLISFSFWWGLDEHFEKCSGEIKMEWTAWPVMVFLHPKLCRMEFHVYLLAISKIIQLLMFWIKTGS